jgi:hypothetical protein
MRIVVGSDRNNSRTGGDSVVSGQKEKPVRSASATPARIIVFKTSPEKNYRRWYNMLTTDFVHKA